MTSGIDLDVIEVAKTTKDVQVTRSRSNKFMQDILCPLPYDICASDTIQVVNAPEGKESLFHSGIEVSKDARVEIKDKTEGTDLGNILRIVANAKSVDVLALGQALDPEDMHRSGCNAWKEGDADKASQIFLSLSLMGHRTGSALYGLATSLCKSGQYREALNLSLVVGAAEDAHPRALVLAGYAAYKLGDANLGRRCLARASRMSRGKPEYTGELRFAQRLLLTQHFGD